MKSNCAVWYPAIDGRKTCSKCGKTKPVVEFPIQNASSTGLRAHCKECALSAELKRNYGISEEGYAELLQKQNGVCAVCLNPEVAIFRGKVKRLSVDHDHKTGKIRGLLCTKCNTALGLLDESCEYAKSLIRYLSN